MRRKKSYFTPEAGDPPPVAVTVERRLKFSEVDALAIAWHGHYPAFFEDAHTELMRKVGLTYECYGKCDVGAPIAQLHVDYHAPLRLDEKFQIRAELKWHDGARLNVEYTVRQENGEVAATGYTVQLFINMQTGEPYMFAPPIYEECQKKWRSGEFHE